MIIIVFKFFLILKFFRGKFIINLLGQPICWTVMRILSRIKVSITSIHLLSCFMIIHVFIIFSGYRQSISGLWIPLISSHAVTLPLSINIVFSFSTSFSVSPCNFRRFFFHKPFIHFLFLCTHVWCFYLAHLLLQFLIPFHFLLHLHFPLFLFLDCPLVLILLLFDSSLPISDSILHLPNSPLCLLHLLQFPFLLFFSLLYLLLSSCKLRLLPLDPTDYILELKLPEDLADSRVLHEIIHTRSLVLILTHHHWDNFE